MASYEYVCWDCELKWLHQHDMVTIVNHLEYCPECRKEAERQYSIGMIKVTNGNSPTRFGKGDYQRTAKSRDAGFQNEFNSIFGDAGIQDPNTGEDYKIQDDVGGDGTYLAPDSQKKEHKRAVDLAREKGTLPTMKEMDDNRAKFHENSLRRARERLREWSPKRKGSKS